MTDKKYNLCLSHEGKSKMSSAEVRYRIANFWQYKGKIDQAIKGYRETLNLEPGYVPAQLELGNLLVKQGDMDAAIELYREAMVLNPLEPIFQKKLQALVSTQRLRSEGIPTQFTSEGRLVEQCFTTKKRLLLYADNSGMYGAGQCNHILIRELAKRGFSCTFVQPKASHHLVEERRALGIEQIWIEEDDLYTPGADHQSLWNGSEAERVLASTKPDLIIFSDGCPVSNLAAKQVAGRMEIPYLVIVHCVTPSWAKSFSKYLETLRDAYQKAAGVIAVSKENLSLLRQLFQLPTHQGEVIHNGVPESFFSPVDVSVREKIRREIGVPPNGILCLTVGRMETVKGYQYQMKAIEQLQGSGAWPNLFFSWVGTGSLEPRLRAWVDNLGIQDRIKFLGERTDIPDLLSSADIFILPSIFEGMPLSIAEAMAKGLPIAASGISGIPEELGLTGYLLPDPSKDPVEMVMQLAHVIQLWAANPTTRQQIGSECKKRAEAMFRVDHMLERYLGHIERVLAEGESVQKT
jgi:glycosyltransferase involved in cell wall biosynthesis